MKSGIKSLDHSVIVLGVVALLVAISVIVMIIIANSRTNIAGTLSLYDPSLDFEQGEACWGDGGYSDITGGAQVTVSNGGGSVIAVTRLIDGKMNDYGYCVFRFFLNDIPKSDIYQIEVASRGKVTYSQSDIEEKSNKIELSLGD